MDYTQLVRDAEAAAAGRLRRGVIPQDGVARFKPRGPDEEGNITGFVRDMLIPQTPADVALMALGTPLARIPIKAGAKALTAAAGAVGAMLSPEEAQAKFRAALGLARRASPEEITRAARGSAGMTQPELRKLYNELGLTGQPPSELVEPSLRSQPAEAVAAATELKMADRAALDTLSPEQRKVFQKGGDIPGFRLPSQEAAAAGKAAFDPIKKEITRAEKAFDRDVAAGRATSIFDLSPEALSRPPNVDQFPLPRMAGKVTARIEPAMSGGLRRIESAAAKANPRDWWWYNIQEPLQTFPQILGRERGPQAAGAWVDALAGTSMVNPIESNVRGSSHYLGRVMRGEPLPEVIPLVDPTSGKTVTALAGGPPPGYGAKAQQHHASRVREYLSNEADPVANAKPFSYRQNLGGNYMPRTIDTHDIRNMVGMPRALTSFGEEGAALLPGEYTTLEQLGGRAAERAGMPQAAQQGATWIGGAEYTGLKSQPIPLADVLNRRAQVTAAVRGITPEQAWVEHVTGRRALLGVGGTGVTAGGLSQPAAPEQTY